MIRREGIDVRYLRPIYGPADETSFHLFEAASAEVVAEANRRAHVRYERIVEAMPRVRECEDAAR